MFLNTPPSYQEAAVFNNPRRAKIDEIECFESTAEKKTCEELGDFYSIFRAMESLELAYSRDSISVSRDIYSKRCERLIEQFKDTETALINSKKILNTETFIKEYNIDCPRAIERFRLGIPAPSGSSRAQNIIVAQITQAFITALDALKLDQRAVDEIHPHISDLMYSLKRVHGMKPEFIGIVKVSSWLSKLSSMKASDSINENDVRELIFDLETSYNAFHEFLKSEDSK